MSIEAINWALPLQLPGSGPKLVLIVLANYADEYGECWPSQKRLADVTCMTDRAVRSNIAILLRLSFISVKVRPGTSGQFNTNVYVLDLQRKNLPPEESSSGPEEDSSSDQRKNLPPTHLKRSIIKRDPSDPSVVRIRDKKSEAAKTAIPPAFEMFWERSTKRGPKKRAMEAWIHLRPSPELAATIDAAMQEWKLSEQWQDETKQPHVSGWLNREGWTEIVPRSRRPTAPTFRDEEAAPPIDLRDRATVLQQLEIEAKTRFLHDFAKHRHSEVCGHETGRCAFTERNRDKAFRTVEEIMADLSSL